MLLCQDTQKQTANEHLNELKEMSGRKNNKDAKISVELF